MTPAEVAQKLDARVGFEVIAFGEVGLPVYDLLLTTLVLQRRERDCIEEFALRAVAAGLDDQKDICGILGLPERVVERAVGGLFRAEALRRGAGAGALVITERGRQLVEETEAREPLQVTLWVPFDGLLRKPKWFGDLPLLRPREARAEGLHLLKPVPGYPPDASDLSASDVSDAVTPTAAGGQSAREVLRVTAIERTVQKYLPAVAVVFRAVEGSELQVALAVDGRSSREHELAFARVGGLQRHPAFRSLGRAPSLRGIGSLSGEHVAALVQEAADDRRRRSGGGGTASAGAGARAGSEPRLVQSDGSSVQPSADAPGDESDAPRPRAVAVHEHPRLLEEALAKASRRLLLLTPGVSAAMVTDELLAALRACANRGLKLRIGISPSSDATPELKTDAEARRRLKSLAATSPGITVAELDVSSASVLACDDDWLVLSSFEWLKWRGVPARPLVEARGVIVREPTAVRAVHDELEALITAAAQV